MTFKGKLVTNFKPQLAEDMVIITKKSKVMDPLMFDLFSIQTPHGLECHIVDILQERLNGLEQSLDEKGNLIVTIGKSETLFSCHMDTVQPKPKDKKGKIVFTPRNTVLLTPGSTWKDTDKGYVYGAWRNENGVLEPSVLGGDDKVGIWMCMKLIEAKVPGTYIFHIGEECGGIGSHYIANNNKEFLSKFKRAIAFDRKGYKDVITRQSVGTCASKEFGEALAAEINKNITTPLNKFESGAQGTFTDTASYIQHIPECTNISCGYHDAHTTSEKIDLWWITRMFAPAILAVEWENLPTKRDHTVIEKVYSYGDDYWGGYGGNYGGNYYKGRGADKALPSYSKPVLSTFEQPDKYKDITLDTPFFDIPTWHPDDMFPIGFDIKVRKEVIRKWYNNLNYASKTDSIVDVISNLMDKIEDSHDYAYDDDNLEYINDSYTTLRSYFEMISVELANHNGIAADPLLDDIVDMASEELELTEDNDEYLIEKPDAMYIADAARKIAMEIIKLPTFEELPEVIREDTFAALQLSDELEKACG